MRVRDGGGWMGAVSTYIAETDLVDEQDEPDDLFPLAPKTFGLGATALIVIGACLMMLGLWVMFQ